MSVKRQRPMTPDEGRLVSSLIDMVTKATANTGGGNEREVVTVISRPLWRRFMVALDHDPNDQPTPWHSQPDKCRRVYGSETIVVDCGIEMACSMPRRKEF